MITWLKNLLTNQKKVKQLESEIEVLNNKIDEKQEVINKTNAYWKKKLYHQNRSK
jgi:peptidoglycan hydrolase CwlO-like protein